MVRTLDPLWTDYIRLLRRNVVPALGCTEPVAVALASAECRRLLGRTPQCIMVWVSHNIYKNGMGVGVPGTGMVGLAAAAAIGAVAGDPDAGLEVLKNVTPQHVPIARALRKAVTVAVKDAGDPLYAEVQAEVDADTARVVIRHDHANIVLKERNGTELYRREVSDDSVGEAVPRMAISRLIEFAVNVPLPLIEFMQAAAELNSALSDAGQSGEWGMKVGRTLQEQVRQGVLADDLMTLAMRLASAASDARMGGAMLPAMSNCGSGNQGIAATMPVVAAAKLVKASREKTIRAIVLSHTVAIYIKSHLDSLSALCAASTAAMGSGAAITWLLGGDEDTIGYCIQNMIGDVAGIICDGAKPSCSMKVSTGAAAAVKAALLARNRIRVSADEGIVAETVEQTIANLGRLGRQGMMETDRQIVSIMLDKR
jgi:L-cysteine desulfidase